MVLVSSGTVAPFNSQYTGTVSEVAKKRVARATCPYWRATRPYMFTVVSTCVAATILAAVEGGILPPGMASLSEELTATAARVSAGQDARLWSLDILQVWRSSFVENFVGPTILGVWTFF